MTRRVNWIEIFFSLFCVSLLVSMSAMDAFASLIFLGLAIQYKVEFFKQTQLIPKKLWILLGVWVAIVAIGLFVNISANPPWPKRIFEFKWILFLYSLVFFFHRNFKAEVLKKSLIFVSAASVAYSLISVAVRKDFFQDFAETDMFRVGGFFGNPMTFAHIFQFFVCGVFAFLAVKRNKNIWHWVWFLACFVTLLLTHTRGIWIAIICALCLGAIFEYGKKSLYGILTGLILLAIFASSYAPIRNRIEASFDPGKSYDSERVVLWKTNLNIFLENPVVGLGYGENKRRLREYYDKYNVPQDQFEGHAHNQYLHFLAGTGLLGFLCYLVLLVYFMKMTWRNYRQAEKNSESRAILLGLLLGQITFIIGGMTESNFEHAKVKYTLCLIWALALYFNSKNGSEKSFVS